MGRKITIDSATLINKALEVIEAHWLFDLAADQIQVVLHSESILHSAVEFCDGSIIAQLGRPDMTTPIAYALSYPDRPRRGSKPLDLASVGKLTLAPLAGRFGRAVNLGYRVIEQGGVSGAVLNAANETAVARFLAGKIPFGRILDIVEEVLNLCPTCEHITLAELMARMPRRESRWRCDWNRNQRGPRIEQESFFLAPVAVGSGWTKSARSSGWLMLLVLAAADRLVS